MNEHASSRRRRRPGQARKITPRDLAALPVGRWLADPASSAATSLEARRTRSGVYFYFRFQNAAGRRERLALGRYDPEGGNGLTVAKARSEAAVLTERVRSGGRDLRAQLAADALRHRRELEAEDRRQRAQREAENNAAERSLGHLVEAYVASLEARAASSWKEVRGCFRLHLEQPFPALWQSAAGELTVEDLLPPVARLVQQGKLRQAAVLRSCLCAAYSAAIRARTDPSAPEALRVLRIRSNPARDLATVRGAIRARERALSAAEMCAYYQRLQVLDDPHRALLLAHLLLGAQRIEQLARATVDDWDRARGLLTLRDPKGRRSLPRLHLVPVLPPVASAFNAMRRAPQGPYVWTLSGGRFGADYTAAAQWVERIARAMVEAGEVGERFTLGDLRRSVETLLASLRVPLDVRGQLQSHGLGGIQSRHYDRHDYADEKAEALRLLWATVDPEAEARDRAERERLDALARNNVRAFPARAASRL